jgi:hypothetical protein
MLTIKCIAILIFAVIIGVCIGMSIDLYKGIKHK